MDEKIQMGSGVLFPKIKCVSHSGYQHTFSLLTHWETRVKFFNSNSIRRREKHEASYFWGYRVPGSLSRSGSGGGPAYGDALQSWVYSSRTVSTIGADPWRPRERPPGAAWTHLGRGYRFQWTNSAACTRERQLAC